MGEKEQWDTSIATFERQGDMRRLLSAFFMKAREISQGLGGGGGSLFAKLLLGPTLPFWQRHWK
jgi:hypothetical protein